MVSLKQYLAIKSCVRKHVKYLKFQEKWDNWNNWNNGLKDYLHFEDKVRKAEKDFITSLDRLQELGILNEHNEYINQGYANCIVKLQKRHAILRAEFARLDEALED